MPQNGGFFREVYNIVKLVPRGKVTTYGDIARALGKPKMSRQVGWALHSNPEPIVIPCHRVVFSDGSLSEGFAFGGRDAQKALLESENVAVEGYKVDIQKYRADLTVCPTEL